MQKLLFLFLVLISTYSSIYSQQKALTNNQTAFDVLFIGNSLTYTNNLPELVKEYAISKNIAITTNMIAFPNYSIQDHWNDGQVQKLISSKTYDFVIIQQGPSSQPDGRNMLINYGKKYTRLCKLIEAKLCYFMVWPSLHYYYTFDGVIKNHTDAAAINNSILLPVGTAWKAYSDTAKNNEYYGDDGFHPSLKGSEIAAKVIVDHLLKQ
ncbi:SGNH/GDSL hydrolase family protein [Marixanthomonas ophiurae]|uniref:SGNH/GDSL hydrolase family protein n=1 Tax=Marixanthomonas ophiurae TaxID=387659 RepID=A0A3E1Q8F9_9FLAO|nr:SGNH/GDSL hydrolase family protein [Marixanthomonas ophiurae]RFN58416.1 SGNH/GDSL hydrolase family protein [Marixanthomonas ophiurae]